MIEGSGWWEGRCAIWAGRQEGERITLRGTAPQRWLHVGVCVWWRGQRARRRQVRMRRHVELCRCLWREARRTAASADSSVAVAHAPSVTVARPVRGHMHPSSGGAEAVADSVGHLAAKRARTAAWLVSRRRRATRSGRSGPRRPTHTVVGGWRSCTRVAAYAWIVVGARCGTGCVGAVLHRRTHERSRGHEQCALCIRTCGLIAGCVGVPPARRCERDGGGARANRGHEPVLYLKGGALATGHMHHVDSGDVPGVVTVLCVV